MTIIFITLAGEQVETSDVKELKRRAANGEITPDTIINVDGTPHLASKIKGLVFGTTANETPSTPSVPPEVAEFFSEQTLEEENTASFAPFAGAALKTAQELGETLGDEQLFAENEKTLLLEAEGYITRLEFLVLISTLFVCVVGVGLLGWTLSEDAWGLMAATLAVVVGAIFQAVVFFSIMGLVREHFKIHAQLLASMKREQLD